MSYDIQVWATKPLTSGASLPRSFEWTSVGDGVCGTTVGLVARLPTAAGSSER